MDKLWRFKSIGTGVLSVFLLILSLVFLQSNAIAADMTFQLAQGLNGISLPFENTGITDAAQLCEAISYCESTSYWDASTQKFATHVKGSSENNFPLVPGYPYFVSVTEDTTWTVSGLELTSLVFNLITTTLTDINTVAIPYNGIPSITNAEDLANNIPNCDVVWFWDSESQGFVGHPKGASINNFAITPGAPYFVNVTQDGQWQPFEADLFPPQIVIVSPATGSVIDNPKPNIVISFSDSGSGINASTFVATINGVDKTSSFNVTGTGATHQVATSLPVGANAISVSIRDKKGNVGTATSNFTVKPLISIPRASPTSGIKPLTVTFTTGSTDTTGTIIHYEWDFKGDGTYDTLDYIPTVRTYTYTAAGTYNATLKVTDNNGLVDVASVTITVYNAPPTVTCTATPTNGPIPLTVSLNGSASSPNGAITKYEWDFDGDGVYDWSSTTAAATSYIYPTVGTYKATLRVTDILGLTATASLIIRPQPPGSPTVSASASPNSGSSPLAVNFTGSATSPNGGITNYEWDFDNDGVFDWSSTTTGNTSYTYNKGGIYDATLRVTDVAGAIGIGSVRISVNIILSLTRNPDSFNPSNSGTTTVTTAFSGAASVNILVKDRWGTVVRNLVSGQDRSAGTYNDTWDGKDDTGTIALDGSYYFVAEAIMPGGLKQTYDITGTGVTSTQRALGGYSATYPGSFSPYSNSFCTIGYTVPAAGEVTADISPYDYYGERVKALLIQTPQAKGSHTLVWDGTNDSGQMIFGGNWLVTIWSYDLTANGVVVYGSEPAITNIAASPTYYDPSYHADEPVGYRNVSVSYTLSKNANVTVRVYDMNNNLIRTMVQPNVPAGNNTVTWDGRNDAGELVLDKGYKLGLRASDSMGNQSMTMYAFIILYY
jgi:PKD repeat protein